MKAADLAAALRLLDSLYCDVDTLMEGQAFVCRGCGECCHFETAGHILFASRLERERLGHEPFPPPESRHASASRCPYQVNGRECAARGGRPLGCRLHFCEDRFGRLSVVGEHFHARLKEIHEETGIPWEYAPLLPFAGQEE